MIGLDRFSLPGGICSSIAVTKSFKRLGIFSPDRDMFRSGLYNIAKHIGCDPGIALVQKAMARKKGSEFIYQVCTTPKRMHAHMQQIVRLKQD